MNAPKNVAIIAPIQSEQIRGVLLELGKHQYRSRDWIIQIVSHNRAIADLDAFNSIQWDAIIYGHQDRKLLTFCQAHGIPIIDINNESQKLPGIMKVRPDNFEIGKMAGEYLRGLALNYFAYCGIPKAPWSEKRRLGFESSIKDHAKSFDSYSCAISFNTKSNLCYDEPLVSDEERSRLARWLEGLPKPIGIFASDDRLSRLIIDICMERSIHVPDDIAVLGSGNERLICELHHPTISSIDLNCPYCGRTLTNELLQLLTEQSYTDKTVQIPPLKVVERQSTDWLATDDETVAKALKIINERACSGLQISDLASQVHISRRLLEQKFRKCLGKSPNMVIRNAQISTIKRLLTQTDRPISEIAYDTGFENPEYMHVLFKKLSGITPGAYRHKYVSKY